MNNDPLYKLGREACREASKEIYDVMQKYGVKLILDGYSLDLECPMLTKDNRQIYPYVSLNEDGSIDE